MIIFFWVVVREGIGRMALETRGVKGSKVLKKYRRIVNQVLNFFLFGNYRYLKSIYI